MENNILENIKKTPEYKEFIEYFTKSNRILFKNNWKFIVSGNLYIMLNEEKNIRSEIDYYMFLFSNYYQATDYEELNVCLKLIYLFYKDIYIVFNTIIINKLDYTFNYIYQIYPVNYDIIEYLYENNKNYTFSKLYAYYEYFDYDEYKYIDLPIKCFYDNTINNFTDIFDLIKLKIETTSDSELAIQKHKTKINGLYDLIKYNQTGGMSINRICWIRLVVFISNR